MSGHPTGFFITIVEEDSDFTGVGPPTDPSLLSATPDNTVPNVTLNWTQGAGVITSVKLYRQVDGGGFSLYQTLGVVVTYQDNGVSYGHTYDYKVADSGPGGDSGFSNTATAVVAIDPTTFATPDGWWKADSFALADGTAIGDVGKEWVDQMGVSNHYGRQTAAANRPVFHTNVFGTMPAIQFTNTDDFSVQQFLDMTNGSVANAILETGSWTIICVHKSNANTANHTTNGSLCGNAYVANGSRAVTINSAVNPNSLAVIDEGLVHNNQSTVIAVGFNTLMMATYAKSGGNSVFRVNKTDQSPVAQPIGNFKLSHIAATGNPGVDRFTGVMAEIVIYPVALTNTQLDSLYDNYFKPRWGLP